jgi:hypothetical protein
MSVGGSTFNLTGLLVASKSVLRYSEGRTKQYGAFDVDKSSAKGYLNLYLVTFALVLHLPRQARLGRAS